MTSTAEGTTMKAIQIEEYGNPADVLKVVDLSDVGAPAAGELVIEVEASPINPYDLLLIAGSYGYRPRLARHRDRQRGRRMCDPGRIVPVANALRTGACAMAEARTTAVIQRYLDELGGDSPAEPIVRALLDRAVRRLHVLCATLLYKSYPRLTQPPLNLQADELLGAVVERLLKALREARPRTVRQLFALANQHMRWELNDLARRLDEQPAAVDLCEELVPSPVTSGSGLTPDGLRMLQAIDALPEEERETFDLVRIQGLTQSEAAEILGVTIRTVRRRLNRSVVFLTQQLDDLRPSEEPPSP